MVDRAKPRCAALRITAAPAVSAAKPCGVSTSLIRRPIVWMIRHPPIAVPAAIASPAATITHSGGAEPVGSRPTVISVRVITPMVFCASLVPCASATIEAETTCAARNPRVTVRRSPRAAMR